MTRLVLIRHGQTEWNKSGKYQGQSDVALSGEGLAQARCLAEHFPIEKLDAIYASDLSRAMVTAILSFAIIPVESVLIFMLSVSSIRSSICLYFSMEKSSKKSS